MPRINTPARVIKNLGFILNAEISNITDFEYHYFLNSNIRFVKSQNSAIK